MSDPVSNAEIEDVLSSIRRLVTEDNWQEQDKPAVDAPKVQDRLMLTPALRVKDDTGTNAVDAYVAKQRSRMADAAEPESTPDLVSEATDDATPVETVANQDEMASPLNNVSFTDQAETPTGSPWTDPVATLFNAAQEGENEQDDEGAVPDSDDLDEDEQSTAHPQDTGLELDAEALDVADAGPDQSSDQDSEAIQIALENDVAKLADTNTVDIFQEEAEQPEALDVVADQPALSDSDEDNGQRVASLGAKIKALEAAIGETADQWEPDGALGDDYAGTTVQPVDWPPHNQPETSQSDEGDVLDTDRSAAEEFDDLDGLDLLAPDDSILDEESLRELVADIVREELQGALGERITRNVRKLVRREIHRALAAQDLD